MGRGALLQRLDAPDRPQREDRLLEVGASDVSATTCEMRARVMRRRSAVVA